MVSTHRVNYAHLDPAWSEAGRATLSDLLARLAADGATFLVDAEVRSLHERGWSLRPLGEGSALLRRRAASGARARVRVPVAGRIVGATVRDARGSAGPRVTVEAGHLVAEPGEGDLLLDWTFA